MAGRRVRRVGARATAVLLDRPWLVVAAAATIVFGWWVVQSRKEPHAINVAFSAAVNLSRGLDVQVDGVDVGKIKSVDMGSGDAIVKLGIDDSAWPLHRGTTAEIRYGTTVGNGTRFIQLHPGARQQPEIPEGGAIGEERSTTPVEFDQFFNTMDRPTRRRFQRMLERTGTSVDREGRRLNRALQAAPPAVDSLAGVLGDLASDQNALVGLIANGDRTTATLAGRREAVGTLLDVASRTFDAFARRTDGVRDSIDGLPGTLRETRSTLSRLSATLPGLTALVTDVRPGARSLGTLAPAAAPAIAQLRRTADVGERVLRSVSANAPSATRLLRTGGPFLAKLGADADGLAPAFACVSPYSAEIAGFLSTWAGFSQNRDAVGHYARTQILQGPTSVANVRLTSAQLTKTVPGVSYAMPRPPGLNEGRPRFLPACGAGRDALDPSKDPEARP